MRSYKRPNKATSRIVTERISALFKQAREIADKHPDLADRYVVLARKLSTKNKVKMPRGTSRLYCRNCNTFFIPGKNVRIRTREGRQIYYCLICKHHKRFPFVREQKAKRRKAIK